MNPLNHFGIRIKFIRGDTSSYNDESNLSKCVECRGKGYITLKRSGDVDFHDETCSACNGKGKRKY